MAKKLLISSVVLLIVGNFGRIYATNYTYIDENNILHDSAWLPISALTIFIGTILLLGALIAFAISYLKNR